MAAPLALWPSDDIDAPLASCFHLAGDGPKPAHPRYRKDPIRWAVERMGIPENTLRWSKNRGYRRHIWDGDKDPLVLMWEALAAGKSVGVESAVGTQKTYTAALIVLWFLDCWVDALVITAAPRELQLEKHLWKEVSKLWPRFHLLHPYAELTHLRIRMRPGSDVWSAYGQGTGVRATEESATRAQGAHEEHMLIITEETPGMDDAVLTAYDNTCTAPHNLQLRLGNPDHQLDPLHQFCERPSVVAVRMSGLDHPNVVARNPSIVPGATSRVKIEERRENLGEDHPLYQSRTRGISPTEALDALIRLDWLRKACPRSQRNPTGKTPDQMLDAWRLGPAALGADIANSKTGDKGSVTLGHGALLESCKSWPSPDARVFTVLHITPNIGAALSAAHVGVDTVGVGASAGNELTRLGHTFVSLVGGGTAWPDPTKEENFADLRSQMYWTFAQELFHGEIAIAAENAELFFDLVTPKWGTRGGKIFVESKEKVTERLPERRSPDMGDSAVYWNWVRKARRPGRDFRMASSGRYTG